MKKLAIIHNLPIDYYPPAVNLINTIKNLIELSVVTTRGSIGSPIVSTEGISVYYAFREKRNGFSPFNLLRQLWFIIYTVAKLVMIHPDVILYYESISAAPVYFYKRFINRKVRVNAHYHEYMTRQEYLRPGMRLWERYRRLEEKWLWKHTDHISHTNSYRMDFFRKDYPFIKEKQCYILPNYPPGNWRVESKQYSADGVVRFVYIGSLSLKDMYLKEFIEWINRYDGKATVDFYAFNFHPEIVAYFESLSKPWITLHPHGVNYFDIPMVLKNYDVGVLLYKAQTLNYQYNETNKLYEYLTCGLKVVFPTEMTLLWEMARKEEYQEFLFLFNSSEAIWPDIKIITDCQKIERQFKFSSENIYKQYLPENILATK